MGAKGVRILHTADWQLGMPFRGVAGDNGARLREARLECIDRIAALAHERAVDFVVVAGDLFDAHTVEDRVVVQACQRLARFAVPVLAIPGNHDAGCGPESVWRRDTFQRNRPSCLRVLDDRQPLPLLDGRVVVLPAPLLRRHEVGDTTAHLAPELGRVEAPGAVRIGLAHGAVVDFGAGEEGDAENLIAPDRAARAGLDYLALGDWHGTVRVDDRTWYSGTPEPTGYNSKAPGNVLLVEIDAPGAAPRVEIVPVARMRWVKHAARIETGADVDALGEWFAGLERPSETLVRLELEGSLGLADTERLEMLLSDKARLLVELRLRGLGIFARATDEDLLAMAGDGYVRTAIDRLRAEAAGAGPDAGDAARALQLLYRLNAGQKGAA